MRFMIFLPKFLGCERDCKAGMATSKASETTLVNDNARDRKNQGMAVPRGKMLPISA
jgi:hypothetical protein